MTVTTALKHTVTGTLVLLGVLGCGCVFDAHAQSTTKVSEDHRRGTDYAPGQKARAGVLSEDEAPFKVSFQCSTAVPGAIFAELSWPVANAEVFSTTAKRLSVTTEHDGFESGSYGEIQIRNVEPFNAKASGSPDGRAYLFATTMPGQSITVRRNDAVVQRSSMFPAAVAPGPGQTGASSADPSMDYPTRLLARLRVVGRQFDSQSTAPRGTVTMAGLEANVAYRFRLSEGSESTTDYVFVAPACITDYAGPRPD